MNYTLDALTTVADCDAVLTIANKEREDLDFKKLSLQRQVKTYGDNTVEISVELAGVQAELDATNTILNVLPAGAAKDEQQVKKTKLEYKIFLLNERKHNYGSVALLDKQFELGRVERELEETTVFIDAVETRKTKV